MELLYIINQFIIYNLSKVYIKLIKKFMFMQQFPLGENKSMLKITLIIIYKQRIISPKKYTKKFFKNITNAPNCQIESFSLNVFQSYLIKN